MQQRSQASQATSSVLGDFRTTSSGQLCTLTAPRPTRQKTLGNEKDEDAAAAEEERDESQAEARRERRSQDRIPSVLNVRNENGGRLTTRPCRQLQHFAHECFLPKNNLWMAFSDWSEGCSSCKGLVGPQYFL